MQLVSENSEYRSAVRKLIELRARKNEIYHELERERDTIESFSDSTERNQQQVEAYLKAGTIDDVSPLSPKERTAQAEQRAYRELHLCDAAIDQQEIVIRSIRYNLSLQVCKEALPEYSQLTTDVVKTLIAASKAVDKERKFRQRLDLGEVQYATTLNPCVFRGLGDPENDGNVLQLYLRDAVVSGHMTDKEVQKLIK